MHTAPAPEPSAETVDSVQDPREPVRALLRHLRCGPGGLDSREAARRLVAHGPNQLQRRGRRRWPAELAQQLSHPLALLLWIAALLAWGSGTPVLAVAIVGVILLNALLAFAQERQAERAVEALAAYLPAQAKVLRDGRRRAIDARELVPGDVLILEEGDRVSADARLLEGSVEVDMSTLSGESLPAFRSADLVDTRGPLLEARDLVFSGVTCTEGEARALVFATGMRTELGRIAALSERVESDESRLEREVRRVAWIIAVVAVGAGLAFLPLGLLAGLRLGAAISFAIGLLVANVPEGLLPTITLALAVGVRVLARRGALVKRLSAVETLGSTTVICTDKTGTLTENRMRVTDIWTSTDDLAVPAASPTEARPSVTVRLLAEAMAACNHAEPGTGAEMADSGDPTEIAMLRAAAALGVDVDVATRSANRRREFHFDPGLRLMSTVDATSSGELLLHCKGAPEAVLARSGTIAGIAGHPVPLDEAARRAAGDAVARLASQGLRVLAVARRSLPDGAPLPQRREEAERDLCLLGLVAMVDPPRAGVRESIEAAHAAGIRIIVVTGDAAQTAATIAHQVGIARERTTVVTGEELDAMSEAQLDGLLAGGDELIFARSSPEAKLRIADALRAQGHVVAMTGDGVNDAPALRRADIGVAMGRSGTDVAREAATMVLTDDNFATIVAAVEEGRRVYDNVRRFVLYIFTHAVPEVVPFLAFALSGGLIPAPITPLQILSVDLGTDTLPALALSREPAEPGVMSRAPRPVNEPLIRGSLLARAWGFLGVISAALVMGGFLLVMLRAGWRPGDRVAEDSPLHHAYLQATTMTFLGIVSCQVGTAFAARTERVSLRSVGLLSNPALLAGVAFATAVAATLVYVHPFRALFGNEAPPPSDLAVLAVFPVVVCGADEVRKWLRRRRSR